MFKWSITLKSLVLVLTTATSVTYASEEVPDPHGLFKVSSGLFLSGEAEGGADVEAALDDPSKPSNTNAPKDDEAVKPLDEVHSSEATAQSSPKHNEVVKYLFGKKSGFNSNNRSLRTKLKIRPLLELLQTLQDNGPGCLADLRAVITSVKDKKLSKLCYKYKKMGYISQGKPMDPYSITPLGTYALELIRTHNKPESDSSKRRSPKAEEDDVEELDEGSASSDNQVKRPSAPKKAKAASSILPGQMKNPVMHHGILKVLQDGLYHSLEGINEELPAPLNENKNLTIYLGTQQGYKWLICVLREEDYVYKITKLGQQALTALAERVGDYAGEKEVLPTKVKAPTHKKRQREEELSDSSELIPNKLKRPELHYGLLLAMGVAGKHLDAETIYKNMGRYQPSKAWKDFKDSFTHHYLASHVKNQWLTVTEEADVKKYSITHRGIKVRDALVEQMDLGEEEDKESSSSSSREPTKKRKSREKTPSDVDGEENEDEEKEYVPAVAIGKPVKVVKAAPAPVKKVKIKTVAAKEPSQAAAAPIKLAAPSKPVEASLPNNAVENIWGAFGPDADADTLSLAKYPPQLQKIVKQQVEGQFNRIMDDGNFLDPLREKLLADLTSLLGEEVKKVLGLLPVSALKDFISQNVSVTIRKQDPK